MPGKRQKQKDKSDSESSSEEEELDNEYKKDGFVVDDAEDE